MKRCGTLERALAPPSPTHPPLPVYLSLLLITCDHSLSGLSRRRRPTSTRDDDDGGARASERLSSQIVCTFHLIASSSIRLFTSTSAAGVCAKPVACVSVACFSFFFYFFFSPTQQLPALQRQTAGCVKSCRGNVQTKVSGGLCVRYRCWERARPRRLNVGETRRVSPGCVVDSGGTG